MKPVSDLMYRGKVLLKSAVMKKHNHYSQAKPHYVISVSTCGKGHIFVLSLLDIFKWCLIFILFLQASAPTALDIETLFQRPTWSILLVHSLEACGVVRSEIPFKCRISLLSAAAFCIENNVTTDGISSCITDFRRTLKYYAY